MGVMGWCPLLPAVFLNAPPPLWRGEGQLWKRRIFLLGSPPPVTRVRSPRGKGRGGQPLPKAVWRVQKVHGRGTIGHRLGDGLSVASRGEKVLLVRLDAGEAAPPLPFPTVGPLLALCGASFPPQHRRRLRGRCPEGHEMGIRIRAHRTIHRRSRTQWRRRRRQDDRRRPEQGGGLGEKESGGPPCRKAWWGDTKRFGANGELRRGAKGPMGKRIERGRVRGQWWDGRRCGPLLG